MDTQSIVTYKSAFDAIMHEIMADDGSQMEVWYARELQQVCGYARWENFQVAINRAKDSCNSQNISIDDHFRDVTKTIPMPKGAQKRYTYKIIAPFEQCLESAVSNQNCFHLQRTLRK